MKIVIIGGGIAGVSLAAFLDKQKNQVVICERELGIPTKGNAFLMHNDGLEILNELKKIDKKKNLSLPGKTINKFVLLRPSGKEMMKMKISSWQCIKRSDLINFLYSLIPFDIIRVGRIFDKFLYENGKVVAAVFKNGDVEYGDIFIGADGSNSVVRTTILGATNFSAIEVKEVLGIARNKEIAASYADTFTKIQSNVKGIAFGFIPTNDDELVWFMQYDPKIKDVLDKSANSLKNFCLSMTERFPDVVREIFESDDFNNTYVWYTRDFDLLPTFHKDNVVLIGDAAHLSLPFTSAGTTNALRDAKILVENLTDCQNYDDAFQKYYLARNTDLSMQLEMGRKQKANFLNPLEVAESEITIPLIYQNTAEKIVDKTKIKMLYFSDPICSTCWTIQPQLRRLQLEYGEYIDIDYHMGGLLPSWDGYSSKTINQPIDAADHWEEASDIHDTPLLGNVWLKDPLKSSFPPSIAFKAAQNQGANIAISFLRRLREMLFLENKNISRWDVIHEAAFDVGLDVATLRRDYEGNAVIQFKNDLELAKHYQVLSFPSIFFIHEETVIPLKEYRSYDKYEQIIKQLIFDAKKKNYKKDPKMLFDEFITMSTKEFAFFMDITLLEAIEELNQLYIQGDIDKYVSRNGSLWKTNKKD